MPFTTQAGTTFAGAALTWIALTDTALTDTALTWTALTWTAALPGAGLATGRSRTELAGHRAAELPARGAAEQIGRAHV